MWKQVAGASSIAVLLTVAAWAQSPAGPEFRVNTYTAGLQSTRSVAADASGNFVVAWNGTHDGSIWGVFGQRYTAAGLPLGGEFQVNTWTPSYQFDPTVASAAGGDFVVVWTSFQQDGHDMGVFGQRFSAAGAPLGGEFRVNTSTMSQQGDAFVSAASSGNFVVAWRSHDPSTLDFEIFGQRFSAAGGPLGGEFKVNTSNFNDQQNPFIASDASGNFVVVWMAYAVGVFGQRFSAAGAPLGAEFQVNTSTLGAYFSRPAVALDPSGGFVVVWNNLDQDGTYNVFAQRFGSTGARLGSQFRVNTDTANHQHLSSVASDPSGAFLVVWTSSDGQDGSDQGVFGQRFSAAGAPVGSEFQINTYTTNAQIFPAVAVQGLGKFVVTWNSNGQDGSYWGVFAQRFGGLEPIGLAVDATVLPASNGNRVFEAGETVTVSPSWRNATGAAQSLGGSAGAFTGPGTPGDPVYAVVDGSASYGTVPDGAVASCTSTGDCYALGIGVPSARPVHHWDAAVREDLTPPVHGQAKEWTLHVGDSFSDVPRASGFYRFIETLLHRGVTGGCGGTQFCPAAATTREQMAVFVLVAKEGAVYVPPACAVPVFGDVPASSPFCRWIEELARRGVAGGCGGGNYCPGQPVTREQMAVFVLRTLDPALVPPPCAPPNLFADVPETSGFCRWIEELATRAIVTGCGGGNYCPSAAVTREQMGVFLGVTFGLTLYGP